jgi:hypothetical protein
MLGLRIGMSCDIEPCYGRDTSHILHLRSILFISVKTRLGFAIISSESTLVTSPFLILESLSDVQINELQLDNQGEGRTQSRSFSTHQ